MNRQIVIAGAGQAAVQAIDTLRRHGFEGRITLVGEEPWLPYQRPPLSKKYLDGSLPRERLTVRAPAHFEAQRVEVRLGRRVDAIERREQRLRLDDGTALAYDALLLATGSRPRQLSVPGGALPGVHVLRTIADADRIRPALTRAARLVIIGGGYIGLEVAASARALGVEVTILEMTDRIMGRVTSPEVSGFYAAEHARHGVTIRCGETVRALHADPGSGRVAAVLTESGASFPADLVIAGVGVVPADELAQAAGLECENGVQTDAHCCTSDPAIFAAGDCASHLHRRYGRHLRLESVDNAFEQGTTVALNLIGTPTPHDKVPWFWSDQYDLKFVIVGLNHGYDERILRGEPAARSFSVCYLRAGELVALDSINTPHDQMAARKLIAARARPERGRLADPSIPLRECA